MAKEKLTLHVESLKLSSESLKALKLSGIDQLEDFNTFNLKELNMLLGDSFDEIKTILRRYQLPRNLENLNLSDEIVTILTNANIHDLKEFLEYDRHALYHLFEDDALLRAEINQLLNLYGFDALKEHVHQVIEEIELVDEVSSFQDIDLSERIHRHVQPIRKGYGSRTFSHLKIRLASPEEIRQWSYGEVKTHETINYRTSKPEEGGLFCERIFGPTRDYQCACGKKQSGNKGQICNKCGIEITESKVRRERMGHIELEAPVVHTWYLKNSPSRLAILLGIKAKALEEVVYHASYIVTDPGNAPLAKKQILSEMDYSALTEEYGSRFIALTGAEAVKKLLQELDLDKEVKSLRRKLKTSSKQKRDRIIKRLEVVEAFNNSDNKPEWMVMDVIPVIPPDLRPMVALDGGRFATTDLNDLYRRILNRNNRLKKQKEQMAPRLITKNEKRMLQEAVDALFDNAKRGKKAAVERNRHLKSLSDMLRGKQGRFRQNLLGKRVDYSGRSVIIVGPDLEMYQCGIPREMAIILFKPFVLRELQKLQGNDANAKKNANSKYERMDDDVWAALEKVVREHPVLLNRAPTLHRLGIQAFEPKLIDGKAIRLHPLVTPAFNADFDGDQMAVHVPLSNEAQAEARLLMLASNNILNPKDGKPVVTPSQDMVLGNYYLTIEEVLERSYNGYRAQERQEEHNFKHRNEGKFFVDFDEAYLAYQHDVIGLHTRIVINPKSIKQYFEEEQKHKYLVTTLGKLIFNRILPPSFPYLNEPSTFNLEVKTPDIYFMNKGVNPKDALKSIPKPAPFKKKFLSQIIAQVFKNLQISETSKMLDRLKDLGFKYSTVAGITVSFADINVYSKKHERIEKTNHNIEEIGSWYEDGMLTDSERRDLVIKEWQEARDDIQNGLMAEFDKDNNIYMMSDSGARGNASNFAQLAGMRGLMNNPKGEIIEVPVQASFREGLTVSEFFISTHGARKGSTDTALKTAESGYLTRRLVDVSQDVICVDEDCGTERGVVMAAIMEESKEIVPLYDRIVGRFVAKDVVNPKTKEVYVKRNELVTEEIATSIIKAEIKQVEIRSNLTCNSENGVCAKCYGRNLATNTRVEVGEAVGVVAAQSIGEPGTQLTMRTFHTGGVASASDITQGLPRIQELFEARNPKGKAVLSEVDGKVKSIERQRGGISIITIVDANDKDYKYQVDPNVEALVRKGAAVKAGQKLTPGSINPKELLRIVSAEAAEIYILEEVQKVYRAQGVEISDKHIELIIRQMLRRISIVTEGDTELLPGTEVSVSEFKRANKNAFKEFKRPAVGRPILLGITRASLRSDSFLSAASFQETTRILTDAAIKGKTDELHGLKENVIIGGLIPAGTGILRETEFNYNRANTYQEEDELDY
jgi:DNA-directed RNA polymerase subunit beta'